MKRLFPVLVALASLGAFCARETRPPTGAASPPRPAPSPLDVAALSAELSEPAGYFDTDNLISNETAYLQVADQLAAMVPPDGVYVGVGPEQNFSYIARVRPRYAFILDIRRGNLIQHLFLASILAHADDPYQYLCRLFARACPAATPEGAAGGAERALDAALASPATEEAFAAVQQAADEYIARDLRFALSDDDRRDLRKIARAFFEAEAEIRFRTFGRPGGYHPTYRTLLLARSPSGRFGNFLDSAEDYRFVRDLSRGRRLVPVVGDFAGTHALRAIGTWVRGQGLTVSAFYLSNVEFYLMRNDAFSRFAANVGALPATADSVLIRACFDYGRPHPLKLPGHRSVALLQRVPRFLELAQAGAYTTEWDVCTADYLR